jgi:lipopolysaccharide transport system ATP-binding protein
MSFNIAPNTSPIAIDVQGVSKRYRITHDGLRRPTFRDVLMDRIRDPFKRRRFEDFWALNEVSFQVPRGEVIGVIGRNGAGKSTLLKILSRVTEPTTGKVDLYGRVGSLLEVGTGFHPELTGRENIYLNGAMLGMRRREITRQFDAIVAFAEVEKFLDTPVKRYSSGMYVRLAFAVAAHLETEILLVDEVLAVGDAQFQTKCLGKMGEVARTGRTILFVSHNLHAVEQLCTKAIWMEKGRIREVNSNVRRVIHDYIFGDGMVAASRWINNEAKPRTGDFVPLRFGLTDADGRPVAGAVTNDSETFLEIEAEIGTDDPALEIGYVISSEEGQQLYWSYQTDTPMDEWPRLKRGRNTLRTRLPRRLLNEGTYRIELISSLHCRDWILAPGQNAPSIFLTIQGGLSDSPYWMGRRNGILAPVIPWEVVGHDATTDAELPAMLAGGRA